MANRIAVINGPNLNMLGTRETGVYGNRSLKEINAMISGRARDMHLRVAFFQSNSEGELVSRIQACRGKRDGIVLNAGAYTHYSIALRDAISAAEVPTVEVHISNVFRREPFRHVSVLEAVCTGQISGLGPFGYVLAMHALSALPDRSTESGGICEISADGFASEEDLAAQLADAGESCRGVILATGGFTGDGSLVRHAAESLRVPCVEVRGENSTVSGVCSGVIGGFGAQAYPLARLALDYLSR